MRLESLGNEDQQVRVSMGRRDLRAYGTVIHSTVRRAVANTDLSSLSRHLNIELGGDLAEAKFGLFRTVMVVGEGTLDTMGTELGRYHEIGMPDELAVNPNSDPVQLAKIAQHAGKMASTIEEFLAQ